MLFIVTVNSLIISVAYKNGLDKFNCLTQKWDQFGKHKLNQRSIVLLLHIVLLLMSTMKIKWVLLVHKEFLDLQLLMQTCICMLKQKVLSATGKVFQQESRCQEFGIYQIARSGRLLGQISNFIYGI